MTGQEAIRHIAERPICVNGQELKHDLVSRNLAYIQYRQRLPSACASSVHYEVCTTANKLIVRLDVERNAVCPDAVKARLGLTHSCRTLDTIDLGEATREGVRAFVERAMASAFKQYEATLKVLEEEYRQTGNIQVPEVNQGSGRNSVSAPDVGGWGTSSPNYDAMFSIQPKEYCAEFDPNAKAQIVHAPDLMGLKLRIPNYQRPYKWSETSVLTLMDDIADLVGWPDDISEDESSGQNEGSLRKYRIGSVILQRMDDDCYNIVDGQQRLLTLVLLFVVLGLGTKFAEDESFFRGLSQSKESAVCLRRNFRAMANYLADPELKKRFQVALEKQIEIVVITVDSEAEAFQLFDCQNTRGRKLGPQDLLKAYHLREIDQEKARGEKAVEWDRVEKECYSSGDSELNVSHKNLFDQYLFRILKWSKGEKPGEFTEKDLDLFKGVPRGGKDYGYAIRASQAMPCYQIGSDFIAGEDFFTMVETYRTLLKNVIEQIRQSEVITNVIEGQDDGTKAFAYARQLFYAVVLAYCDRFGKYDELAARKLCAWAFMLRVDLRRVGDKSIVKYAVGGEDPGSRYTNKISMFAKIRQARRHTEISNMVVEFPEPGRVEDKHKALWNELKNLIGA